MAKEKTKDVGKKKNGGSEQKVRGPRKGTRIAFLRELFKKNPNIGNKEALERLLTQFPESNADVKSILIWKQYLRKEGIPIPKQRAGRPAGVKPSKKAKKVAKVKREK